MQTAQIPILQQPDGSFAPHPNGLGTALVTYNYGEQGKTAIIAWNGINQAVLTFDSMGNVVVSYFMMNPAATMQDQVSVENIGRYLTSAVATLH